MLLNGTLTYYNKESKQFKTIFIQDIDDNLNPEFDSFALLNKYYSNNEEAIKLFSNDSLSHFKKDNISYQKFDIQPVFSNSIEELLNNIRELDFCVNYIYYDGIWYHHIFHLFESIVNKK